MKTHIISALVCFALSFSYNLKAQDAGTITGTVVDAESGETLIGVNVVLQGTTIGTSTNLDGQYTIKNIEPGSYTLEVSYISFQKQIITGVEVNSGEVTKLDITLQPETEKLEDVIITAEAILDNEAGLLRQRQKAISFSDAISAESISSSGSGDAAGALKKVVGASVVDGKYVFIRGLGDRYTSTHLNGSELPSADPNRKSFQLDIFPSNLLENIVTLKTFTPDKPGNFSGGLVDIATKDFPEQFSFQASASTGFNTKSTFTDLVIGDPSSTDYLGFDGGRRGVPQEVRDFIKSGQEFPTLRDTRNDPEAAETLDRLSNAFNNEFRPREQYGVMDQSYGISIGNQVPFLGNDLGYTASFSYSQGYSGYDDGVVSRYDLVGNFDDSEQLFRRLDVTDIKGQRNVDWGGMATLSYRLSDAHKVSARFLRTQSGTGEGRYLEGFQYDIPNALFQTRVVQYTERSLSSFQLSGKSYFENFLKTTIEWKAASATNIQDEPDLRYFTTQVDTFPSGAILHSSPTNNFQRPGRFYRNLEESNRSVGVDVTIPFNSFNGVAGNIKFGGNLVDVDRDFREQRFDFYTDTQNFTLNDVEGNVDAFFDSLGILGYSNSGRPEFGNYVQNASTPRSNYDATRTVSAAYLMTELPVTDWFRLIGGVRLEQADIEVVSQDTSLAVGSISNTDYLPSINGILSLTDNMNIRAAYTKTVARPTFRELAPYITFDFVGGLLFQGNENLKRTLITNYDLRWELFTGPGEILAVSGFYKELKNPLERVIRTDIGNDALSIQNVEEGRVYGLELEVRKNLGFLTENLRHFSLATNYTLVRSYVDIPELELLVIRNAKPDAEDTRELQGQSPFLFNFDLGYSNPDIEFNSSVSYNYFGDRLGIISEGATPDIYERGYGSLNFTANKTIADHFELSFKVSNILDPYIIQSQSFNGDEYFYQRYKRGRTFSLGIKYKI
ncbi:MAG: TonB-dependent receptor [Gracilimonas sp.]|uniref:TonB-dependent receptor n=1 Tax=Gracilimonas TaxID=649462 RepID=UPI001B2AF747|nr:TonB-dependent receptor [Gracilimonas sp.]MBO6585917.1 TonB-dependent receptor [Gracilimonas sp.]MBO6616914.1 TonB-dependent receptor [Gracilimonas sp.]